MPVKYFAPKVTETVYHWFFLLEITVAKIMNNLNVCSAHSYLYPRSRFKMRSDSFFCWYWWNSLPSLFKLSFNNSIFQSNQLFFHNSLFFSTFVSPSLIGWNNRPDWSFSFKHNQCIIVITSVLLCSTKPTNHRIYFQIFCHHLASIVY